MVFNLFGKRRSAQPSFIQQLETLYEGNAYQGILELSRKLVKEAGKLYPDYELKNKHLLPLLSNMARKLSEDPDHLDDAVTLSTQIIDITLREPSKLAEEDTYRYYVDLEKVRDEESAFLSQTAKNMADQEQKCRIYSYLSMMRLKGAFSAKNNRAEWFDLHANMTSSLTEENLSQAALVLAFSEAKLSSRIFEADADDFFFQEVLDTAFDVLIRKARESKQPAAALVNLVIFEDRPYKWDKAVQKALAEELNKMASYGDVFEFCVAQALKIPETKAKMPTASYIIETVLDGVIKPELVPNRRAFEKDITWRTSSSCDALARALDDLRGKEKDLACLQPKMHGGKCFITRQRKFYGLYQ